MSCDCVGIVNTKYWILLSLDAKCLTRKIKHGLQILFASLSDNHYIGHCDLLRFI